MKTQFNLDEGQCTQLITDLSMGRIDSERLRVRSDSSIYRIRAFELPIIVKFWSRPGLRGIIRRSTKTSPAQKEIGAAQLLQQVGITVPQPIAYHHITLSHIPWTDASFFEDLGNCVMAMYHVQDLIKNNKEKELSIYLDAVIEMTRILVFNGIVDPDHNFNNIVTTPSGKVARLDFELAFRSFWPWFPFWLYGRMLGFLIGSYVFTVQPDVRRASDFSDKLISRLKPPRRVLREANRFICNALAKQKNDCGIDTKFTLLDGIERSTFVL